MESGSANVIRLATHRSGGLRARRDTAKQVIVEVYDRIAPRDRLSKPEGFAVLAWYGSDQSAAKLNGQQRRTTKKQISVDRRKALGAEIVWLDPKCNAVSDLQNVQRKVVA